MELIEIIKQLELFDGLTQDELFQVADICEEKRFHRGDLITKQGEPGEEFYIVTEGFTEILLEVPQRVVASIRALGQQPSPQSPSLPLFR
jgi:CRP-like cAMP-binding protein